MTLTRSVPTAGMARVLRVRAAMEARRALPDAPGWTALIAKAYGLVAARRPELRHCMLRWPWARIHEHDVSVCSVVSEREWRGESAVFMGQVVAPESMVLAEVQYNVEGLRRWPIESIGGYRRMIRFMGLPWPLRPILLRIGLHVFGAVRARYFGTFTINTLGHPRLTIEQSMTVHAMALFHGLPDAEGRMPLTFFFDHRLIDGMVANRAIGEVEAVLNGEIAGELRAMVGAPAWHPPRR